MSGQDPLSGRYGGRDQLSLAQVPSMNPEAERAVLGTLLIVGEPRRILRLVERGLTPGCFTPGFRANAYAAMVALAKRNVAVDGITLRAELETSGTKGLEVAAEIDALHGWGTVGNVLHYADIIINLARWRKRLYVGYEMVSVAEKRDDDAWEKLAALFRPTEEEAPQNVVVLRTTMNEDGEVLSHEQEERRCQGCADLADQVKGLEKDLRAKRLRIAHLEHDREAAARDDGMWQLAQRLFLFWQQLTGHTRSPFSYDRFEECAPYLRRREHGPEKIARAIVGMHFDPWVTTRRNGTKWVHDEWKRVFKDSDQFEEFCRKVPANWEEQVPSELRQRIQEFIDQFFSRRATFPKVAEQASLRIAE